MNYSLLTQFFYELGHVLMNYSLADVGSFTMNMTCLMNDSLC